MDAKKSALMPLMLKDAIGDRTISLKKEGTIQFNFKGTTIEVLSQHCPREEKIVDQYSLVIESPTKYVCIPLNKDAYNLGLSVSLSSQEIRINYIREEKRPWS